MDDETPRHTQNSPAHEEPGSLRRPPLYPAELWAHKGFSGVGPKPRSESVAPPRSVRVNGKKRRGPEYAAYHDMLQRCTNPKNHAWDRYGGRGIRVCARWLEGDGFARFAEDMGPRPRADMSLDRIDNAGDYEPDNCRWTTTTKQNRNTRVNNRITVDGETMCVTAWAERVGMGRTTINNRLRAGWTPEQAVKTPPGGKLRIQAGVKKRCTVCGELGHNRRTCEAA